MKEQSIQYEALISRYNLPKFPTYKYIIEKLIGSKEDCQKAMHEWIIQNEKEITGYDGILSRDSTKAQDIMNFLQGNHLEIYFAFEVHKYEVYMLEFRDRLKWGFDLKREEKYSIDLINGAIGRSIECGRLGDGRPIVKITTAEAKIINLIKDDNEKGQHNCFYLVPINKVVFEIPSVAKVETKKIHAKAAYRRPDQ